MALVDLCFTDVDFADLTNVPADLQDGDADLWVCSPVLMVVPVYSEADVGWICGDAGGALANCEDQHHRRIRRWNVLRLTGHQPSS